MTKGEKMTEKEKKWGTVIVVVKGSEGEELEHKLTFEDGDNATDTIRRYLKNLSRFYDGEVMGEWEDNEQTDDAVEILHKRYGKP